MNFYSTLSEDLICDLENPSLIYLKVRDKFNHCILLESSDYNSQENSYSFVCFDSLAQITLQNNILYQKNFSGTQSFEIKKNFDLVQTLNHFLQSFKNSKPSFSNAKVDGLFGHINYNCVPFFENIEFKPTEQKIPVFNYHFYRFVIVINNFNHQAQMIENIPKGQNSSLKQVKILLSNKNYLVHPFELLETKKSNLTDKEFKKLVSKGIELCKVGDVFQIVLSRIFIQKYRGDDFQLYRALRTINPSPYLFYFDYRDYKILGSSPETQIKVQDKIVQVNPIAGTFRRTGDDDFDRKQAKKLLQDEKECAEHNMLIDLARNDLSKNCDQIEVSSYQKVQFFSHVIHMVSQVKAKKKNISSLQVFQDTFPAGTLSGAPKYRAMQKIDEYENTQRDFYGGSIGFIGFNGNLNKAIMIRTFLVQNNFIYTQSGAGIVVNSKPEKELEEVNNKLAALSESLYLANRL